jgi:predicted glycoside hydrolase/deacetylase ChbG (UPF0249 family)
VSGTTFARSAIVNADDFGHSDAVNAGVVEAHERGVVTSASLMVLRAGAREAAAYGREHPELSVGLHVDLGEWIYVDEEWTAVYEVDASAIGDAIERQLEAFRDLIGRDPTHVDSHQHVHLREPSRSDVVALGRDLGVPVRHLDARTRYCGDFYGQTDTGDSSPSGITVDALVGVIRSLQAETTEICCHPGKGEIHGSSYSAERERELEALCHPDVRSALVEACVRLVSFRDVS